jgi:hypothetical protein
VTFRVPSNALWHSLPGVVAAYQPIAAPSYNDSLLNVGMHHRMVGKYTATPGVAPTWNARTGWGSDGTAYFVTPWLLAQTDSVIVRYSGAQSGDYALFGSQNLDATRSYWIKPKYSDDKVYYQARASNAPSSVSPGLPAGVLAISNRHGYRNGIDEGFTIGTQVIDMSRPTFILGMNKGGVFSLGFIGSMQAFLLLSRPLTAAETWLASRQMAYCELNPDWNAWAPRRRYWFAPSIAGRVGIYGARPTIALPGGVSIRPGTGVGP